MNSTSCKTFFLGAAAALALWAAAPAAMAASISYPDQGPLPPGYMFTDISESSGTDPVPLYGPPTPFLLGLDFTPVGFGASAAGGSADLTHGQLNYTIMAGPNTPGIPIVSFAESGLFSLAGAGTAATSVTAGASLRVTVREINGASVAPILLAPAVASVSYDLLGNPGVNQPWGLSATVNVAAQLFALLGPNNVATKADVVIDNALAAISESLTNASIIKTDIDVTVTPEPAAGLMMGLALLAVPRRRYRRATAA
ncbi:MAG TPA: hypothetical protein PJ982_01070 [Lacipirellulaceae bacterium]|nr:hypothetical protein [Lacipirellulaceae bacterium]